MPALRSPVMETPRTLGDLVAMHAGAVQIGQELRLPLQVPGYQVATMERQEMELRALVHAVESAITKFPMTIMWEDRVLPANLEKRQLMQLVLSLKQASDLMTLLIEQYNLQVQVLGFQIQRSRHSGAYGRANISFNGLSLASPLLFRGHPVKGSEVGSISQRCSEALKELEHKRDTHALKAPVARPGKHPNATWPDGLAAWVEESSASSNWNMSPPSVSGNRCSTILPDVVASIPEMRPLPALSEIQSKVSSMRGRPGSRMSVSFATAMNNREDIQLKPGDSVSMTAGAQRAPSMYSEFY
jgi:hypothetical protein